MKRLFILCAIAALLCGCGAITGAATKVESDIVGKVDQAVSFPDLANAKVGAQKLPEPQRSEAIQCFAEQEAYLHQVEAALAPAPASAEPPPVEFNPLQIGFATLAVNLQLGDAALKVDLKQLLMAKIPPVPRQLLKDCGPVYEDSKLAAGRIGLSAAALIASATKGAELVKAAAALQKAAAAARP